MAVLTFVVGSQELVAGVLDSRELLYSPSYLSGPSVVSANAYKLELLSELEAPDGNGTLEALLPSDAEFKEMFEAERLYRLALSHQTNRRRIVVSSSLLAVATLLFATHWVWLTRRERSGTPSRSTAARPGGA